MVLDILVDYPPDFVRLAAGSVSGRYLRSNAAVEGVLRAVCRRHRRPT